MKQAHDIFSIQKRILVYSHFSLMTWHEESDMNLQEMILSLINSILENNTIMNTKYTI